MFLQTLHGQVYARVCLLFLSCFYSVNDGSKPWGLGLMKRSLSNSRSCLKHHQTLPPLTPVRHVPSLFRLSSLSSPVG